MVKRARWVWRWTIEWVMITSFVVAGVIILLLAGCVTVQTSDRCRDAQTGRYVRCE